MANDTATRKNLIVAVCSVAWVVVFLFHFFGQPLPNNSSAATTLTRTDIWQIIRAEWLLLLNPLDYSGLTQNPAGWSYLPQRFPFLAVAALIWISAAVTGAALTGSLLRGVCLLTSERVTIIGAAGLSLLSLWVLGCGLCGLLVPWAVLALPTACALFLICRFMVAAGRGQSASESLPLQPSKPGRVPVILRTVTVTIFCVFGLHIVLGGMTPPFDFDVREYHLQGPKEWFQQGQVTFLSHNVYTSFPFLSEMLSLAAMVLHDDWWKGALSGKLTLASFQLLSCTACYGIVRRCMGTAAGLIAAAAFLSVPWVTRISIIAYAEGAITCYIVVALMTAVLAVQCTDGVTRRRLTLLTGFLAGSAMAAKYPGLVSSVLPCGFLLAIGFAAMRMRNRLSDSKRVRIAELALIYTAAVLVAVGPWLLKNLYATGNPVYPLGYRVFGGTEWDEERDMKWRNAHRPPNYDLARLPHDLHDVAARNDWQSGLLFALAVPAILLASRYRTVLLLAGYVAWLLSTWWLLTHRIDRFWVPVIPLLAILCGASWKLSPRGLWKNTVVLALAVCGIFNYAVCRLDVIGFHAGLMDMQIAAKIPVRKDIRFLNLSLPQTSRVLMTGEAEVFDARFRLVYNTVFNDCLFEEWTGQPRLPGQSHRERETRPVSEIREIFQQNGITHIYVNWAEILRYRLTYGYTEYVEPERFQQLQHEGLLVPPVQLASANWPAAGSSPERQILSWAGGSSLRTGSEWSSIQLYRVRTEPQNSSSPHRSQRD